ncbi:MAG TPA: hypothetical protein VHL34_07355 [Rhizomicrobium sp.]|jgi:hypothetical protein|nr:hypothetical protein [Rhizomicrobium sp.]
MTVGSFTDGTGVEHGFMRTSNGVITPFDIPKASTTTAFDINMSNVIVGTYTDANGAVHGFIRKP